eukprot:jgi/Hompol1/2817/HPOL_003033-RA
MTSSNSSNSSNTAANLPPPLIAHQHTLYLSFTPKSLPYAEIAAFHIATKQAKTSKIMLRTGLSSDLLGQHAELNIPKGPLAAAKTTLVGKSAIVRCIARLVAPQSQSELYPESEASLQRRVAIDAWIDSLRSALASTLASASTSPSTSSGPSKNGAKNSSNNKNNNDDGSHSSSSPNAVVAVLEAASPKGFLVGDTLSLADLVAWDALVATRGASSKLAPWLHAIHAHPELAAAAETVHAAIAGAPLLDSCRRDIAEQLLPITGADPALLLSIIEEPRDHAKGDLTLPLPRLRLPGNHVEVAQAVCEQFKPTALIEKAVAVSGFINFFIRKEVRQGSVIKTAITLGQTYGTNATGFGKFGVVEFSSPNIAKPFHVGHIRSTIIGNFIKKMLDASGWGSISLNYLGDWGKQYGLLAVGFQKYGNYEELESDPIRHLYEVYVRINSEAEKDTSIHDEARAYFKRMEDGDQEAYGLWKRFRDLSIVKYKEIYGRLNIEFDVYSGESQYSLNQMRDVLNELSDLGLLVPDQGALIVDLKKYKLDVAVIGKTDGSLLYLSRDIAAAIDRHNIYDFEQMFYVVGNQQDHHFKQLFRILELQGKTWAEKCNHIGFGMIKTKDGNMSTRKGTVVFLEDILANAKEEMHSVMLKNENKYAQIEDPHTVADIVGQSAIMIQDMSSRRSKDYVFDWSRVFSFEGDTGPYLQYAHSRLCSIERQAANSSTPVTVSIDQLDEIDFSQLTEPQAFEVIDAIAAYPDVVREVGKTYEPCGIVAYAMRLSHSVSSAIDVLWVANQPRPLAQARLALYVAARITLGNALSILGFRPLTRM